VMIPPSFRWGRRIAASVIPDVTELLAVTSIACEFSGRISAEFSSTRLLKATGVLDQGKSAGKDLGNTSSGQA
jgi:hypothetical protein